MDFLFKNTYVRNREMAKELYGFLYLKRKTFVLYAALLAMLLVLSLIDGDFEFFIFYAILSAAFYALMAFVYHKSVKTVLKRDLEVFKKEPTVILTVTNDNITHCIQGDSEYTLEFSSIKKAFQTKNYILLQTKANLIYGLKKDGFTLGTKDEFIAFLESKGIKVKGK